MVVAGHEAFASGTATPRRTGTRPQWRGHLAYAAAALAIWALLQAFWSGALTETRDGVSAFGPDDYMRLVQVSDLLGGAAWHDLTQTRLDPPDGIATHWTRLPDLPIALVAWLLEPEMDRREALLVAAAVVPAGLLLALLLTLGWAVAPLLPGLTRLLVLPALVFAAPALIQFLPGRVDHHAYHMLVLAVLFGAAVRVADDAGAVRVAALAGVVSAVGMWVSHEVAPWLIVFSAALALDWVWRRTSLRAALWFAGAHLGVVVLIMPISHPVGAWTAAACDGFSATTVGFAGVVAVFWGLLAVLDRPTVGPLVRLAWTAVSGVAACAGFVALFPDCLQGPYGQLDPAVAAMWLESVKEARPFSALPAEEAGLMARFLLVPLLGMAYAAVVLIRSRGALRQKYLVVCVFCAASLLGLAYQIRLFSDAALLGVIPAAAACAAVWRHGGRLRHAAARVLVRASPVLALIAVFALKPSAAPEAASVDGPTLPCEVAPAAPLLEALTGPDGRALLIAAPIDLGPELLFRTSHAVVAAPYHRAPAGLLTIDRVFGSTEVRSAQTALEGRGVDLVLVCRDGPNRHRYRGEAEASFVDRLVQSNPPNWLEPVVLPEASGLLAFRLQPSVMTVEEEP